jgi:hypothetical protein
MRPAFFCAEHRATLSMEALGQKILQGACYAMDAL